MTQVTVLMATYNNEKSIEDAICSIIGQTFSDWHLIIVNDASTDSTDKVLSKYLSDERFTIINNHENLGLAASLNIAIRISNSEFLARADADDLQLPYRLQEQVDVMLKNSDVDLLTCNVINRFRNGVEKKGAYKNLKNHEIRYALVRKNIICHPTVMLRRRFFDKAGLYDEKLRRSQDWELWLRGTKNNCKFLSLDREVVKYWTNDYRRSLRTVYRYCIARCVIFYRHQPMSEFLKLIWDMLVVIMLQIKAKN